MIQSPKSVCMAVRRKDGSITLDRVPASTFSQKHRWARLPIVRGVVNLCVQLGVGYRMLMKSADYIAADEGEATEEGLGMMGTLAMVFAVAFSVGLFILLPNLLSSLLFKNAGLWKNLLEGCLRILIFVGYLVACSLMKDMRRVFMYHGAEHRVLHCYEHEKEATPENSRLYRVTHPRCGTSYLFLVMMVSIAVYTLIGRSESIWLGMLIRVLSLPLVAGLAYELLRFAARSQAWWANALRAPGLLLQRLTTRIPTDDMIEVAAAAYRAAMEDV
ncbi:MAG: DUF1385 domain-containing protein [Clostridia bacterium]|nr:DUF1385 domain-containing protein [Clostridia bacterium]